MFEFFGIFCNLNTVIDIGFASIGSIAMKYVWDLKFLVNLMIDHPWIEEMNAQMSIIRSASKKMHFGHFPRNKENRTNESLGREYPI